MLGPLFHGLSGFSLITGNMKRIHEAYTTSNIPSLVSESLGLMIILGGHTLDFHPTVLASPIYYRFIGNDGSRCVN